MSDAPPRPTAKRLRLCVPSQADYTVGDMKLWLKVHKDKDPAEYDIVGPKGRWKMGAGSEVLQDDQAQRCPAAARRSALLLPTAMLPELTLLKCDPSNRDTTTLCRTLRGCCCPH